MAMGIQLDAKIALVVDDSVTQCRVLTALLKEEGYRVFTANDGARGVDMYIKYQPDLVLMDINMPVMNGYEAAKKIKSLSKGSLEPLIFVTNMNTEQAFIESIEAGGDGILVRPFSPEVFKAKIKSVQRISDLYQQVKALQQEQVKDAELAEQLMSEVVESRNFGLNKIGIIKQPANIFSGDIQLTALTPNGDIHVMLGDFTGHGLRSSIGAIPVSETFRAMSNKGFSLFEIIAQVNRQLKTLLPTGLFLAATFVSISSREKTAYIFNAGLPEAYIFDQQANIKHKLVSSHPPLAVLAELLPDAKLTALSIETQDRIVLISDGILEARNNTGEMYDYKRFEQAAIKGVIQGSVAKVVMKDVARFCQKAPQEDDISIIDIPCNGWDEELIAQIRAHNQENSEQVEDFYMKNPAWHWQLHLSAQSLNAVNPIPMIMNQINHIEGSKPQWQNLFTIITELFINALDHGVLGLSSVLKTSAEGFCQYFDEREKRLKVLKTGFVNISIDFFNDVSTNKVVLTIEDSGQGFDVLSIFKEIKVTNIDALTYSGRGLLLVEKLCETLEFKNNGSTVQALYLWK
ncbi:SpoIIE family protein phosphatase [Colwellia sp. BRX8-9]|uniref:ATP-binding SpoIIE family protein phosphatase n=1 Tax=Colwellia sp. BRX8-9 TaxID=2759831 RepID=UPI00217533DD|nr:SpoIIE family protein phosphatase [Colwellia sp. BRX8-9]